MTVAAGSLAGAVAALGIGYTTVTDNLPFEKKDHHAADIRRIELQLAEAASGSETTKDIVLSMQRDQWRTLQLQLEARIEVLNEAMKKESENSPIRAELQRARSEVRQQLSEITMKLQR